MGKYQCKYIQRCHIVTISIAIYRCVNALLQLKEDRHTKLRLWTTAILKAQSSTPDALWQNNTTAIPQQTSCLLPCKQLHRYWHAAYSHYLLCVQRSVFSPSDCISKFKWCKMEQWNVCGVSTHYLLKQWWCILGHVGRDRELGQDYYRMQCSFHKILTFPLLPVVLFFHPMWPHQIQPLDLSLSPSPPPSLPLALPRCRTHAELCCVSAALSTPCELVWSYQHLRGKVEAIK